MILLVLIQNIRHFRIYPNSILHREKSLCNSLKENTSQKWERPIRTEESPPSFLNNTRLYSGGSTITSGLSVIDTDTGMNFISETSTCSTPVIPLGIRPYWHRNRFPSETCVSVHVPVLLCLPFMSPSWVSPLPVDVWFPTDSDGLRVSHRLV